MTHISMTDSSLSGNLIVPPKTMPSIFIHIFPRKNCQLSVYDHICNLSALYGVYPTKQNLIFQQTQIFGIPYFGITNYIFCQNLLPGHNPDSLFQIIFVSKAQNFSITFFYINQTFILNTSDMHRQQSPSSFIFFMANR